ncbi:hypothetical protein AAHA92_11868 [Salvia divinorum]|uniref:Uncharacterized protein n=1 Tax=Salvia divinorum TaxID=28513 RepID=A0ABD1HIE6_SALDI
MEKAVVQVFQHRATAVHVLPTLRCPPSNWSFLSLDFSLIICRKIDLTLEIKGFFVALNRTHGLPSISCFTTQELFPRV